jgi:DinB family protein
MRAQRRQKLESFGRGPALLSATLHKLPKKMWLYRSSPQRWSIHEIILHLADSEASGYVQCRSFIAEPGSKALRPDAHRWADTLGYFHQSTREALDLIRRLRKMTYQLLVNLPEAAWAYSLQNPDGTETNLEQWLDLQEHHIPHHLEQMQQNYEAWLQMTPARSSPLALQSHTLEPAVRSHAVGVSLLAR